MPSEAPTEMTNMTMTGAAFEAASRLLTIRAGVLLLGMLEVR